MQTVDVSFYEPNEQAAIDRFLRDGYVIFAVEDRDSLDALRDGIYREGLRLLGAHVDRDEFFDSIHHHVTVDGLNDFRLALIRHLAAGGDGTRIGVYRLVKQHLAWLAGNELAMQRSCNLSIQLPRDADSVLPVHSDVWSGNSPYEVVSWLPLVDCYRTRSMFVLPRHEAEDVYDDFPHYASLDAEGFFAAIADRVVWLEVPYGHVVLFSHTVPHGNRVNLEEKARWSINVRFKSLLTPYDTKPLGETFLPITTRPATKIGYSYRKPSIR
ncbi:MAG: hypothetical protein JOZ38_07135 [Candidatus Eremiobacteraeota bacterium]|nr:hypothetical protein [Candidatus Eremiobacteraeota bacterium]